MITPKRIATAKKDGKLWKLIARAELKDDGSIEAYVRPEMILFSHPLAAVSGSINAPMFITQYLGEITIIEPGVGREAIGITLLSDILDILQKITS